jgi:predicted RecB family endonuclease
VTYLAAAASGPDPVTLVTGGLLALAAIVSSMTPIVLARRRSRKEAQAAAATAAVTAAVTSSDLTLAGWTTLNTALQKEITRLQGVQVRMQDRIDLLESEIDGLQKLSLALQKPAPGA